MSSKKPRSIAPWASLILIFFVLLIILVWAPFDGQSSSKLQTGTYRTSFIPSVKEIVREEDDETMESRMKRLILGHHMAQFQASGFSCQTEQRSEQCITSNQVRIQNNGNEITIYVPSPGSRTEITIKPYALRDHASAMQMVSPLQILAGNLNDTVLPTCQYNHTVPAVVFSSGGYSTNMFHELDEILIPLFLTSQHFKSDLQFFVTDYKHRVIQKYHRFLSRLSKFEPIDSSKNVTSTHCFPGAIIGLNFHGNVVVNSSDVPTGYTMADFRRYLYKSYHLKTSNLEMKPVIRGKKPLLVLITRSRSRVLLNQNRIVRLMQDLGFRVHVALENELSDLEHLSRVLSMCSVLVGVHGAGLSNAVFLPQGAVLLQVVPLGLKWPGVYTYGDPAIRMGVKHVEYLIEPKESSLYEVYGPDDPVIVDPVSIFAKGYLVGRAVYIEGQNVTVDLNRFRETLIEVLNVVRSSEKNSTRLLDQN